MPNNSLAGLMYPNIVIAPPTNPNANYGSELARMMQGLSQLTSSLSLAQRRASASSSGAAKGQVEKQWNPITGEMTDTFIAGSTEKDRAAVRDGIAQARIDNYFKDPAVTQQIQSRLDIQRQMDQSRREEDMRSLKDEIRARLEPLGNEEFTRSAINRFFKPEDDAIKKSGEAIDNTSIFSTIADAAKMAANRAWYGFKSVDVPFVQDNVMPALEAGQAIRRKNEAIVQNNPWLANREKIMARTDGNNGAIAQILDPYGGPLNTIASTGTEMIAGFAPALGLGMAAGALTPAALGAGGALAASMLATGLTGGATIEGGMFAERVAGMDNLTDEQKQAALDNGMLTARTIGGVVDAIPGGAWRAGKYISGAARGAEGMTRHQAGSAALQAYDASFLPQSQTASRLGTFFRNMLRPAPLLATHAETAAMSAGSMMGQNLALNVAGVPTPLMEGVPEAAEAGALAGGMFHAVTAAKGAAGTRQLNEADRKALAIRKPMDDIKRKLGKHTEEQAFLDLQNMFENITKNFGPEDYEGRIGAYNTFVHNAETVIAGTASDAVRNQHTAALEKFKQAISKDVETWETELAKTRDSQQQPETPEPEASTPYVNASSETPLVQALHSESPVENMDIELSKILKQYTTPEEWIAARDEAFKALYEAAGNDTNYLAYLKELREAYETVPPLQEASIPDVNASNENPLVQALYSDSPVENMDTALSKMLEQYTTPEEWIAARNEALKALYEAAGSDTNYTKLIEEWIAAHNEALYEAADGSPGIPTVQAQKDNSVSGEQKQEQAPKDGVAIGEQEQVPDVQIPKVGEGSDGKSPEGSPVGQPNGERTGIDIGGNPGVDSKVADTAGELAKTPAAENAADAGELNTPPAKGGDGRDESLNPGEDQSDATLTPDGRGQGTNGGSGSGSAAGADGFGGAGDRGMAPFNDSVNRVPGVKEGKVRRPIDFTMSAIEKIRELIESLKTKGNSAPENMNAYLEPFSNALIEKEPTFIVTYKDRKTNAVKKVYKKEKDANNLLTNIPDAEITGGPFYRLYSDVSKSETLKNAYKKFFRDHAYDKDLFEKYYHKGSESNNATIEPQNSEIVLIKKDGAASSSFNEKTIFDSLHKFFENEKNDMLYSSFVEGIYKLNDDQKTALLSGADTATSTIKEVINNLEKQKTEATNAARQAELPLNHDTPICN